MVIVASGPGSTTAVAKPLTEPPVARTVLVNVPATVPAEKSPELLIVPPPFTTDHTGLTETGLPAASSPDASRKVESAIGAVNGVGAIVIFATGPAYTYTVAVELTEPF